MSFLGACRKFLDFQNQKLYALTSAVHVLRVSCALRGRVTIFGPLAWGWSWRGLLSHRIVFHNGSWSGLEGFWGGLESGRAAVWSLGGARSGLGVVLACGPVGSSWASWRVLFVSGLECVV